MMPVTFPASGGWHGSRGLEGAMFVSSMVSPHRYSRHGYKAYLALVVVCLAIASTMGTPA